MTEPTPLDRAHGAMTAAPGDDALRLRFWERLADGELFLLLAGEARGEQIEPKLFETDEGRFALVFDREERLAGFAGAAPYAALSGRALAGMLAGQGVGLGLNLGAPSEILLPAGALVWLRETLGHAPALVEARPEEVAAPRGLPEALLEALDTKLALAGGLARHAWLAAVTYEGGRRGHMLAFVDAMPGAEEALARLAGEALVFSGLEAGEMDVAVFAPHDPICARLAKVGLRFDLPRQEAPPGPAAPGSDPARPPRLR